MSAEILRRAASLMREQADYAVLNHPATLLATAAWLDSMATNAERQHYDGPGGEGSSHWHACAVARAYLGESA